MLRVPALQLPEVLPHPDAIKSWGEYHHSYEPEFWEFQYETYRYLGRVTEGALVTRYRAISANMRALVSSERHVIPIVSFLSSWYWFRKEHQTRLEFLLRKAELPLEPGSILRDRTVGSRGPIRPRNPNAGDVLYRYGKREYLMPTLEHGRLRVGAASFYRELERDSARGDEELSKKSYLAGEYTTVATQDGKAIPVLGDICRTVSSPNYYVLCMSCDWDPALFEAFNSDCCVVIRDPEEFATRLSASANKDLGGWYFYHNPVEYFDPYEMSRNQFFDAAACKDFGFAYQREYRFLWMHLNGREAHGFVNLELGALADIAEMWTLEDLSQPSNAPDAFGAR
jgi:hypothetical protein